jgi:hypothetical protein
MVLLMNRIDLKEGGNFMCAREGIGEKSSTGRFQTSASCLPAKATLFAWAVLIAVFLLTAGVQKQAHASEGGASSFTPGAQGDFGMCYMPSGLYFRNNVIYTEGIVTGVPGGIAPAADTGLPFDASAYGRLKAKVWFDLLQIVDSTNVCILGGRYFAAINIPVGISAKLNVKGYLPAVPAAGYITDDSSCTTGLGDIQAVPFGLLWDQGSLHFLAAQNIVLDTGRYNVTKANNMGRNYFTYDELLGLTWLDETGGHEISFIAGYMFNTKNQATDYKTGDEFHVDYTLAQYFSKRFGLGVVGYCYKQMTDDESPVIDAIDANNQGLGVSTLDGFKSKGSAIGPALILTPTIGGKDVNIIAKWLHEFSMENRLQGEWIYLSGCLKF